ncbi:major facilitator superfamily transporter [Hirsutella rhossiliensis]|uniref:Major facilitator superfamily transporter n=1 Tax=Hirsutella rhossiliensis TaxID=111463 RepID=A0A9P8MXJ3_9HYPO|nr:major facilitator superfamily transporter [Hirsutella rhossiliensis]KAH0962111.1 major facilitator superfamily transporter [Hirsutella rhossiliensis]
MVTKSPTTRNSSPASFYAAKDSETQGSATSSSPATPCPYSEARQLPRELKDHCQIFLEEQIHTCAINLLNSMLGSGISRQVPTSKTVPVPPPSHLALLGTLVIHPLHTTRADKPDHLIVSSLALNYLRNVLTIAGPINAGFRVAFQFHSTPRWARQSDRPGSASDSDMSDGGSNGDLDQLRGAMANEASVWSRGQDLWSTVGWAFNTATVHPHRWRYWKVWLGFMLDVLDADWRGHESVAWRTESMIYMYMNQDGRQTGHKRIMNALFADGGSQSLSAFLEVFEKELRGPKKASRKRKWEQALDLKSDKFGDYFDADSISSSISEPPTPEKRRGASRDVSFGCSNPGLVESIRLRLRFFKLLSAATSVLRWRLDLNQLHDGFAAGIKLLPLQMFALFVSRRENPLLPASYVTIIKKLFHLLLPSRHKDPRNVDPEGHAMGSLSLPMLEHCYISSPANTVGLEDNAKLSLVVEQAMQLLWDCEMMKCTDSFAKAALRGVEAREAKAKKRGMGKRRAHSGSIVARDVLAGSAERIRMLIQLLEASADSDSEKQQALNSTTDSVENCIVVKL